MFGFNNRLTLFLPPLAGLIIFMITTVAAHAFTPLSFRDILDRRDRPTPTHIIQYGADVNQYGELWLPVKQSVSALPVVMLLHGGCWRQDLPGPELVAFLADALRQRGVAVWSVSYRRVGTTAGTTAGTNAKHFSPYPDTFLDVTQAADKLRELATLYPLDLKRVVSTGHSAGGHLAMWLTARQQLPIESVLRQKDPLPVLSTVGIAAMPDLQYASKASAYACGADTIDLLIDTKSRGKAAYLDTSITTLLPLKVKQLLISAVYDAIVAPAQAHRYQQQALAKNESVELLTIDNAGHFELIAPWTAAGQRVVDSILAQFDK